MRDRVLGGVAVVAAAGWWFAREWLKAAFFDRLLHMVSLGTLPLLDWAAEYGPPLAFAAVAIYFIRRGWPAHTVGQEETPTPIPLRVVKQDPLPPATSPNERAGLDFVSVTRAAAVMYGWLGPCRLRDSIDALGETEDGKLRAMAALIFYQSPELWGIKSPSPHYERIEVTERVSRPLQMKDRELILGEPETPRGYYGKLVIRNADLPAIFEQIKSGGLSQVGQLDPGDFEDR